MAALVKGDLETRVRMLETRVAELAAINTKIMDRLLDAVLPPPPQPGQEKVAETGADAEYAEPPPAFDWTDPFIGLENRGPNYVARLEPGELPPFIPANGAGGQTVGDTDAMDRWREMGEGAFEEWNADTHHPHAAGGWVEPLDLEET